MKQFISSLSTVVDAPTNERPVINLIGDNPQSVFQNATYVEQGATASDSEDGNITGDIVITGTVNTAVQGTYTVYYNVEDSDGSSAIEVTRTVNVVEAEAPWFNFPMPLN